MFIIYDQKFNGNEWFVIISLTTGLFLAWRLKKRFTLKEAMVYFLYSVFIGMVLDHTISIDPFDFYDVNDNSSYQFLDFLTYLMYGPYGYMYIYFYDYFKVKSSHAPIYILIWASISILMELVASSLGVYHYKNGYTIFYSFPIYLLTLTPSLCMYKVLHRNKINN